MHRSDVIMRCRWEAHSQSLSLHSTKSSHEVPVLILNKISYEWMYGNIFCEKNEGILLLTQVLSASKCGLKMCQELLFKKKQMHE